MHRDKVREALSAALEHLEDCVKALATNKEEKAVGDLLWSASAETEYAVFLLSLMHEDRAESASWKHGSLSKQSIEFEHALTSALELLKSAKERVEASSFEKGYQETWMARNLLLKAQELLEKKRKEAQK